LSIVLLQITDELSSKIYQIWRNICSVLGLQCP